MKPLITALSLGAAASCALAQSGTITIQNTVTTTFHTNAIAIGGSSGNTFSGPGVGNLNFYYEVLTASSTVTTVDASLQNLLSSTWSDTGVSGTNSALNGREFGLIGALANDWEQGVQQSFIVVGWSATLGSAWAQVKLELAGAALVPQNGSYFWSMPNFEGEGFLGATTVGSAISGPTPGTAAFLFSSASSAQVPIPVSTTTELYTTVPEPGCLALAALGLASLLVFRHRK